MPRGNLGRSVPLRRNRRRTGWSAGPSGLLTLTAAGQQAFGTTSIAALDGLTLARIRGELLLQLTSDAATADGFNQIAVGICDVSENAAGIGITAIPHPLADIDWDGWIWHWVGSIVDNAGGDAVGSGARVVIDNKSMRKTPESNVLVGVLGAGVEIGTAIVKVNLNTRVLDLLP